MLVGGLLAAVVCVFLGNDQKKSIATSRHGEITSAAGSSGLLLRLEELTDRLENLSNEELWEFDSSELSAYEGGFVWNWQTEADPETAFRNITSGLYFSLDDIERSPIVNSLRAWAKKDPAGAMKAVQILNHDTLRDEALRILEHSDSDFKRRKLPQFNSGLANSNSQTAAELHVTFDSFFVDRGYFISGQIDSSRCLQAFAFLRSMSAKEVAMLMPGWFDADEDAIAREAASGPKPSNSRSHLLLDRWLELDPEAARVYVQNRGSDDLLDSYFELQAMRDPLAALNEVEAFVGEDRPRLICVVLRELAKKESVRALTLYETLIPEESRYRETATVIYGNWAKNDPESAWHHFMERSISEKGDLRSSYLHTVPGAILYHWVRKDPGFAVEAVQVIDDPAAAVLLWEGRPIRVARNWESLTDGTPAGVLKSNTMMDLGEALVGVDPQRAVELTGRVGEFCEWLEQDSAGATDWFVKQDYSIILQLLWSFGDGYPHLYDSTLLLKALPSKTQQRFLSDHPELREAFGQ